MRGDGGVACEGTVVDVPKFHSWGTCTISLVPMQLLPARARKEGLVF